MTGAEFLPWRWLIRSGRWCFWLFRKLGFSDFVVVMTVGVPAVGILAAGLLTNFELITKAVAIDAIYISNLVPYFSAYLLISFAITLLYVLRLRNVGIVSADAEIAKGLDYKAALSRVKNGFDFAGIGGAKLTQQRDEFTKSISRSSANGAIVRLLLCDPRASIMTRLEKISGVNSGEYLNNVKQSFATLQQLQKRFGTSVVIRVYKPDTEHDLNTLRLMFINGNFCLLSQNTLGSQSREGRSTPQLHIDGGRLLGADPTLYAALKQLFDQLWEAAASDEITSKDFDEIEAIKPN